MGRPKGSKNKPKATWLAEPYGLEPKRAKQAKPKLLGRPDGTPNILIKPDFEVHGTIAKLYGASLITIANARKTCAKTGCHVCMKEIEDRAYGKPPQEIKHSGKAQPPLNLMVVNQVNTVALKTLPALPVAIETEFGLVEEWGLPMAPIEAEEGDWGV